MKASLDVLAFADTRKAAILGDMFELGENEKQMHREVGIHAVRKGIDVLICIGSLMKSAADGALEYLEQQKTQNIPKRRLRLLRIFRLRSAISPQRQIFCARRKNF